MFFTTYKYQLVSLAVALTVAVTLLTFFTLSSSAEGDDSATDDWYSYGDLAELPTIPELFISDAEAGEDSVAAFLVEAHPGPQPGLQILAQWETYDIDAVAGEDYVAASGHILLTEEHPTARIYVRTLPDDEVERVEKFGVRLFHQSLAGLGDHSSAKGSIKSQAVVRFNTETSHFIDAHEGDTLHVPLTIVPGSEDIEVTVITVSTNATEHADYEGGPFRISIPAGATSAEVVVPIYSDLHLEEVEKFYLIIVPFLGASTDTGSFRTEKERDLIEVRIHPASDTGE